MFKKFWHRFIEGDKEGTETEFLPSILEVTETPPSPVGRLVLWTIVALLIAGKEEDDAILRRLRPYFSDRIQFLGLRTDVPSLMAKADGMCLPSVWEGLPVTLLESLAVGCIPICSPVGGIVNVVTDGRNGLLSQSSREEDYHQAMLRFLSLGADDVARLRQQCTRSFQPYHISNTVQQYLQEYMR